MHCGWNVQSQVGATILPGLSRVYKPYTVTNAKFKMLRSWNLRGGNCWAKSTTRLPRGPYRQTLFVVSEHDANLKKTCNKMLNSDGWWTKSCTTKRSLFIYPRAPSLTLLWINPRKIKKMLNDQNPAPPRGSQQQHWIGGSGVAIVWLEKIDVG